VVPGSKNRAPISVLVADMGALFLFNSDIDNKHAIKDDQSI
jgi:hypothetical protein